MPKQTQAERIREAKLVIERMEEEFNAGKLPKRGDVEGFRRRLDEIRAEVDALSAEVGDDA